MKRVNQYSSELPIISLRQNSPFLSYFFCLLIGLRPASELFWQYKFLGANPQSYLSVVTFFVALILITRSKNLVLNFSWFHISVFFYCLYLVFCAVFNYDSVFIVENFKTITALVTAIAIFSVLDKDKIEKIVLIFCISVILLTIFSYLQKFGLYEYFYYTGSFVKGKIIGRVSGGLSHPLDLNRTLIFFIFILVFQLQKIGIWTKISLFCIVAFPMFWSYHRTTYLCTILILLLYFVYERKYLILAALGIVLGVVIKVNTEQIRFFIFDQRLNFSEGIESSRFRICYESIKIFLESSFWNKIFGSGIFPGGRKHGDGDLPRIIYAYGVIGFLGYLNFLFATLLTSIRDINRYAIFSITCLFSIWLIFSIFVDVTRYPAFVIMFFVCLRGSLFIAEEKSKNA